MSESVFAHLELFLVKTNAVSVTFDSYLCSLLYKYP